MTDKNRYANVVGFFGEIGEIVAMARPSKRDEIVAQALRLFLEYGFKGTSIDLVVDRCRVSKPTVYRHFPDKAALFHASLEYCIETQEEIVWQTLSVDRLWRTVEKLIFTSDAVRLLSLCIGEGQRFPSSQATMYQHVDQAWRAPLRQWAEDNGHNPRLLEMEFNDALLRHLMGQGGGFNKDPHK